MSFSVLQNMIFVVLPPADFNPQLEVDPWRSEVSGHKLYEDDHSSSPSLTPLLSPQAYLSLEGQNREEGGEENIVYLWDEGIMQAAWQSKTGPTIMYLLVICGCVFVHLNPSKCDGYKLIFDKLNNQIREYLQGRSIHSHTIWAFISLCGGH